MSEDDKWLYREFEMQNGDKISINIYRRLYDAVLLMSSDYNVQISKLSKEINIADEIALVFKDEVIAVTNTLFQSGLLSEQECNLIAAISARLNKMNELHNDKLWTLNALQYSADWAYCRNAAKLLLQSLKYVDWITN